MENLKVNDYYVKVVDGIAKKYLKKVIHKFSIADVDDVELYIGGPLYQWQNSAEGKFVFEHSIQTPEWHKYLNPSSYNATIVVVAIMEEKHFTEYYLKFGK